MNAIVLASISLIVGSATSTARAESLPVIDVRFHLAEPTYRGAFLEQELQEFERRTAEQLRHHLKRRFGFLRFEPAEDALVLQITLDSERAGGGASLRATFFSIELQGLPRNPPAFRLTFRSDSDFGAGVEVENDVFLEEVVRRMCTRLRENPDTLVDALFSRIPLASGVFLLVDDESRFCVLPFTYREMLAVPGTEFVLETRSTSIVAELQKHRSRAIDTDLEIRLEPPFNGGIVVKENPPPQESSLDHIPFDRLGAATGVIGTEGVYLTVYVPDFVDPVQHCQSEADGSDQ